MTRAPKAGSNGRLALADNLMTAAGLLLLPAALLGYDFWLVVTGEAVGTVILAGVAGILCALATVSLGTASLLIRRRPLAGMSTRESRGDYEDHDPDNHPKLPPLGGGQGNSSFDWPRV
ncbi:hypothetical protein [Sinomonas sp. ASV322]|uniref:hypothetical protein n=1 Tax=Sinomonas sp. ASV322 TaxID=3041920 RepID=UPI0027DBDC30|nr:hypothetical protein [Sinomonas sp. ASV322]MDQ4501654.1 hypothetical protein [Sinomonas sp. ASV322]